MNVVRPIDLDCPECGGPLADGVATCPYCGQGFARTEALDTSRPAPPSDRGEFGVRGPAPFLVASLGGGALYAWGWTLEDPRYWLADEALVVWCGLLPAWLASAAFVWRPRWGGVLAGLALALPVLIVHASVMAWIRGRLNDDAVGIAAAFAGTVLGGWLLGRGAHALTRRARRRATPPPTLDHP